MSHPSDPVETPAPYGLERPTSVTHAACLHPELINVVRQSEKRRVPLTVAVIAAAVTVVLAVAGVLYSQGSAAGATAVRVEALEVRTREDRTAASERDRRDRERDAAQAIRDGELVEALHRLDSRLGRIEERLAPRR